MVNVKEVRTGEQLMHSDGILEGWKAVYRKEGQEGWEIIPTDFVDRDDPKLGFKYPKSENSGALILSSTLSSDQALGLAYQAKALAASYGERIEVGILKCEVIYSVESIAIQVHTVDLIAEDVYK